MRPAAYHYKNLIGGLLVLCLMWGQEVKSADLLVQPATLTQKAAHMVQLGISRAGSRLISVGERGTILRSDDQGKSWGQSPSPVSVALTAVSFASSRVGWAVGHGGVVLKTSDGGESWFKQLDGKQAALIEAQTAKAEGASSHRLAEAERLIQDGPDKPFLAVWCRDEEHVWVAGAYGLIFASEDGGKTWMSRIGQTDNPGARHWYALQASGERLIGVGEQGTLAMSTDGGRHFNGLPALGKGTLFGLIGGREGEPLLAYGLKGNVYRSADGGAHWTRIDMPPVSFMAGIRLSHGEMILADEAGRLYGSRDGGQRFSLLTTSNPLPVTGLAVAVDGAVIQSGVRGNSRNELNWKETTQ